MAESSKRRGKRPIRETPELPEDVITDIFTRLPVKSLLRFRSVSKRFLTLIDGPHFIKRHLNRSLLSKSNHKLILGGPRYNRRSPNPHLYSVDLDTLDQAQELDHPCGTKILGSANGILCLHNDEKDIALWNLATRKYHKLPVTEIELSFPPGTYFPMVYIVYGFGYDSVSDDYKLLRLVQLYGKDANSLYSEAKVYNLRSNSWQRIQNFPYHFLYEHRFGELACGSLHWVVTRKRSDITSLIVAFDLATNEYRLVDYPDFLEKEIHNVVSLDGCLNMLCGKYFERIDVWVMKDYGVKESWIKLFTVSQLEKIRSSLLRKPLTYSKSGTEIMLLQDYNKILWYSIKEGGVRMIDVCGSPDNFQPEICVESLVPLKSGKVEDYARKKGGKGAKEKQTKAAEKRFSVLHINKVPAIGVISGVLVEAPE